MQNIITEKPNDPDGTLNSSPLAVWNIAATDHAKPIPRNTFTELEPVTLPIEPSAVSSLMVATLLANVSRI